MHSAATNTVVLNEFEKCLDSGINDLDVTGLVVAIATEVSESSYHRLRHDLRADDMNFTKSDLRNSLIVECLEKKAKFTSFFTETYNHSDDLLKRIYLWTCTMLNTRVKSDIGKSFNSAVFLDGFSPRELYSEIAAHFCGQKNSAGPDILDSDAGIFDPEERTVFISDDQTTLHFSYADESPENDPERIEDHYRFESLRGLMPATEHALLGYILDNETLESFCDETGLSMLSTRDVLSRLRKRLTNLNSHETTKRYLSAIYSGSISSHNS